MAVKFQLQAEFGSLVKAAEHFECTPGAFRFMAHGLCKDLEAKVLEHFRAGSLTELASRSVIKAA